MEVTVFGAGYVGLVTGACLASSGHSVRVLDVDADKIETLSAGRCTFFEPGLEDVMERAIGEGLLEFALAKHAGPLSRVLMIAVGTPTTTMGFADLRYVRSVVETVEEDAAEGSIVVMKSTVPPGTGARLAERLARRGVLYSSNPEFLREGSAVADWFETDRVVIGGSPEAVERVKPLYAGVDAPILECDITSAELIKYASNAFLATKISFINEIARLCDFVGADIDSVAHGVGLDARIGTAFLRAGIGYGGSCFPKDARALDSLADMNDYDFQLLRAVIDVNTRQRLLPVRTVLEHLGDLEDKRVAVLGLTFKPETDDTREAPAVEIVGLLQAEGADVVAHNPIEVDDYHGVAVAKSLEDAVRDADAVIVATEWDEYADADWEALAATMNDGAIVFDGRNCLDPEVIGSAGARYAGVGRGRTGALNG
jgi:UDPglucose 6-dehydrogenase